MNLRRFYLIILLILLILSGCKKKIVGYKKIDTIGYLKSHTEELDSSYVEINGNVVLTIRVIDKPGYMLSDSTGGILVISRKHYPPHGRVVTYGMFVKDYRVNDTIYVNAIIEDSIKIIKIEEME